MSKENEPYFTPPITRVHNIFRIRTIVNAITKENRKNKYPNDEEIGAVLYKTGLSKFRREKAKDRIMRRARDHLLTASYMGLLTRVGRPFGYTSTTCGAMLSNYDFDDECPKDVKEEAIFIDKILRLKLTNVYDLQSDKTYSEFRSRPCLYMLYVLSQANWLHEHQLAIATGGKYCDPTIDDKKSKARVLEVLEFDTSSKKSLAKFYKTFGIRPLDRKNMTRNVRPLLDWFRSVGLVELKFVEGIGLRCTLTSRGKKMLNIYSKKIPIWFADLGTIPNAKAALLLFYQYSEITGFDFSSISDFELRTGLVTSKVSQLLNELNKELGINLKKRNDVDFLFSYDVPPENREEVNGYLEQICHIARFSLDKLISSLEFQQINELVKILDEEQQIIRSTFRTAFAQGTAISSKDVLDEAESQIPSLGILSQYRSSFEKETVILLKTMKLNAIKYQGQLADRTTKAYVTRFFENNPEILIYNGVEILVECKSIGEWKTINGNKAIPKELFIYQQYLPEIRPNPNSVMLVYEGTLDRESFKIICDILGDAKDIVFVTKNYIINCLHQPALKEQLLRVLKTPKKYDSEARILVAH